MTARRPDAIYASDTPCPRGHRRRFRFHDACVSCRLLSQVQSDRVQWHPRQLAGLRRALEREAVEELALEIDRLADVTASSHPVGR
jgi:hypothetical protein